MYVGLTDWAWYQFLAARSPGEVNFWRPSSKQAFSALAPGELFLFKLHAPRRAIVGGGFFVKYTRLPVSLAWMAFGPDNGEPDREALGQAVLSYRKTSGVGPEPDPEIGNIVLTQPFFFEPSDWIPEPPDWNPATQQGKRYDTASTAGSWLWAEVADRLTRMGLEPFQDATPDGAPADHVRAWALRRLGQGGFRVLVTDAYRRQCAVTGEHTLPVLEAAHIRPVAREGSHEVRNGLLLRADLHILFDRGYVTLDEDYRFVVSPRLEAEYHNGRDYYARTGHRILLPAAVADHPAPELLAWHRQHVFVA
jgi:putative restriction endonuclease